MKKLFVSMAAVFIYACLQAQPAEVHLSLQSGLSTPLFNFYAKNLERGSFALPGFTASTEISVIPWENYGVFLQTGFQLNPVDVGSLGYEKVAASPPLRDLYIRSEPYRVIHLMAGPLLRTPLDNRLDLETVLAAGVFFSSTPHQLYKPVYYMGFNQWYEITPSSDISFAFGAGITLIYHISPCYQIGFSNRLMHSRASFGFETMSGPRVDVRDITILNSSLTLILRLFPRQDSGR